MVALKTPMKMDKNRVKKKLKEVNQQLQRYYRQVAGTTARAGTGKLKTLETQVESQAAVLPLTQRYYRHPQIAVLPLELPARRKGPLYTPTVPAGT